jgi:hypothetical protein
MAAGRRTRRSLLDGPRRLTIGPERSRNPPYPARVSRLDHLSARAGATVACVVVVGVASAALNFPETRLAVSAARSHLVAGLVHALSHPIRPGDRA